MKKSTGLLLGLSLAIFCWSCKKDNVPSNPIPTYSVPTTYSFTNESDSVNVAKLLLMADQIGAYINLGSNANTPVNATQLKAMFINTGNYFTDSSTIPQTAATKQLNNSGLSLSSICPPAIVTDLNRYFDSIALYSQSGAASHGVAGTAVSAANKKYLFSGSGIFYSQLFKKTINGLCSYQIANKYMLDSVNSTTDTLKLAHYWDRAFGFFAVPNNFPTVTKGAKYMGSYCNQVSAGMNSNTSIMNAFLKGRAAISNNDFVTMKAQANLLIATLDTLNAACVVQEMKETDGFVAPTAPAVVDLVAAMGTMGEATGFVRNFQYNTGSRVITPGQITQLLQLIDSATPTNPDIYNFINTVQGQYTNSLQPGTTTIKKFIQQVYKFTDAQLPLL